MTTVQTIGVLGAGTMGTGIAQACVTTGLSVVMIDVDEERIARGVDSLASSLDRLVKKAKLSAADRDAALGRQRIAVPGNPMRFGRRVPQPATPRPRPAPSAAPG